MPLGVPAAGHSGTIHLLRLKATTPCCRTTRAWLRRWASAELFAWLRELSFVETGPDGLAPHDLARDVLDVDLRWRDLEDYKRTFRAVRAHVHGRARAQPGSWSGRLLVLRRLLPGREGEHSTHAPQLVAVQ